MGFQPMTLHFSTNYKLPMQQDKQVNLNLPPHLSSLLSPTLHERMTFEKSEGIAWLIYHVNDVKGREKVESTLLKA